MSDENRAGSTEESDAVDRVAGEGGSGNGLGGVDAGSPGGMGGLRASGGTGSDPPPGGVSPVEIEEATRRRD